MPTLSFPAGKCASSGLAGPELAAWLHQQGVPGLLLGSPSLCPDSLNLGVLCGVSPCADPGELEVHLRRLLF